MIILIHVIPLSDQRIQLAGTAELSSLSIHLEALEREGKVTENELQRLKYAALQLYAGVYQSSIKHIDFRS